MEDRGMDGETSGSQMREFLSQNHPMPLGQWKIIGQLMDEVIWNFPGQFSPTDLHLKQPYSQIQATLFEIFRSWCMQIWMLAVPP
jgi:hypothetical protein